MGEYYSKLSEQNFKICHIVSDTHIEVTGNLDLSYAIIAMVDEAQGFEYVFSFYSG